MPGNKTLESIAGLPAVIPVFPLASAILLPRVDLPLSIFEPRYLAMVEDDMAVAERRCRGSVLFS